LTPGFKRLLTLFIAKSSVSRNETLKSISFLQERAQDNGKGCTKKYSRDKHIVIFLVESRQKKRNLLHFEYLDMLLLEAMNITI